MVVLPAPEGAENMMSFPCIKEFQVSGSKFQVSFFDIGNFTLKYV
jgi:hypothetical protein